MKSAVFGMSIAAISSLIQIQDDSWATTWNSTALSALESFVAPTESGCQTSSPGGLHEASAAALSSSASHINGKLPQPGITGDRTAVAFPENPALSLKTIARVTHGTAIWRFNARGRAWCLRLGMSASSWDGWAKLHMNPYVAMAYFFIFHALGNASAAYICTGVCGDGLTYYVLLAPLLCFSVSWTVAGFAFWAWGPAVVHYKLYKPVMALGVLMLLSITYMGCLGPDDTVPWQNRFHSLCVSSVWIFVMCQAAAAGAVPGEHPAAPRTSILQLFQRSAMHALLLVDAVSDLALTRSLLTAKQGGCWWFGQPGCCGSWNILITTFIGAAATDFSLVLIITIFGNEKSNKSTRMQRLLYGMDILCIVCELVISVCTLVYLFSLQKTADNSREGFVQHRQREVALGFMSLVISLVVLAILVIGIEKLTRGAHHIAVISKRISRMRYSGGGGTSVAGPNLADATNAARASVCDTMPGPAQEPGNTNEAIEGEEELEGHSSIEGCMATCS